MIFRATRKNGPGWIWTTDLRCIRTLLYQAELRVQFCFGRSTLILVGLDFIGRGRGWNIPNSPQPFRAKHHIVLSGGKIKRKSQHLVKKLDALKRREAEVERAAQRKVRVADRHRRATYRPSTAAKLSIRFGMLLQKNSRAHAETLARTLGIKPADVSYFHQVYTRFLSMLRNVRAECRAGGVPFTVIHVSNQLQLPKNLVRSWMVSLGFTVLRDGKIVLKKK